MSLFDIKAVEADAKAELQKEASEKARGKIKAKLREIAAAEKIVANLRGEYNVLLQDIGND